MKLILLKITVVLVFVLAFFLRAQETLSHNFLFLIDQGRDLMAVKQIVYDHHLTLIGPYTSLQGVFQGPLWYYLLSIPLFLFNGDPWGTIVLMLFLSMLTLLITYICMKKLFGEKTAIFTLFLLAISPEAIAAATYSWNPHPMWLLLTGYIFLLFAIIQGKFSKSIFLWPIIALMFHFETALAVFIFAATLIYLLIFNRKCLLNKSTAIGMLFAFFFFLPQILFDVRHNFLMTNSVINVLSGHNQGLFVGGENQNYLVLIRGHFLAFFINFRSVFPQFGFVEPFAGCSLFLIVIMFLYQPFFNSFSKKEKSFLSLNGGIVLIIFLLTFLYPFPIRYWFLTGFQMFYIVIIGIIISHFSRYVIGKIIVVSLLLVFSLQILYRIDTVYIHPPDDGGVEKIKGKIQAIKEVFNDARGKQFNLLVFTPPVNTDAYDYLIWWIGSNIYRYVPDNKKQGTFYLLIEPDPAKPWSYKGWLETVVKTGTIIETKKLPSGFIIQKRYEKIPSQK